MSGNPNEDGNSKREKEDKFEETGDESSADQNEETSELEEVNERTASSEKPSTSFAGAISEKNKWSVTTDKATSKSVPQITIKEAGPSARLEEPSTSSTGAIPKKGIVAKSSSSSQLEPNYEHDSDGSSLLHPEHSRSKFSPKGLKKKIKSLFSRSCEDVKSGPKTRSHTVAHPVSEGSESEKEEGNLINLAQTEKKKKRNTSGSNEPSGKKSKTGGKLGAENLSKKSSSKSESNLTRPETMSEDSSVSVNFFGKMSDDSSLSSAAPQTDEMYMSSSTEDVATPFSQLSPDSPDVKKLKQKKQKPKLKTDKDKDKDKDKESESEPESET